ncbi:hypothetical protein LEP1GSC021_0141 [Leptospira noguchii str. 1993005606]|nr:hypothetical protein LEP1GSC074_2235 [Leptospira noguchii str. Hook]EPE82996.1 hypothetical protein LEP1GSC021_0141 [Leptospira noguchii str. 1993005606]TQE76672.1 hypothetical protein FF021_09170 [Leptospira noguchii]
MEATSKTSFSQKCVKYFLKKLSKNTKKSFLFSEKQANYRKLPCFLEQKHFSWHNSCSHF